MSKKDFIALAKALEETRPDATDALAHKQWTDTRHAIAAVLADSNDRFNWHRFMDATEGRWTAAQRRKVA